MLLAFDQDQEVARGSSGTNWSIFSFLRNFDLSVTLVHFNIVAALPIETFVLCKGKAVPLQTWSGPEGSRKLRFPDFMTTAQDGGKVVSLTHRPPLSPGNISGTHFC